MTFSLLTWPRPARPAGAASWVSDLSTALRRTGRSVLNTTTCLWAMLIIHSRASLCLPPLLPTAGLPKTWICSPCASTTASAVTARQSRLATDRPLVSSKQNLKPRHRAGAFLLGANVEGRRCLARTEKSSQRRLTQINTRGASTGVLAGITRALSSSAGHCSGEEDIVPHVLIIVSWLGVANGAVISTQEFT